MQEKQRSKILDELEAVLTRPVAARTDAEVRGVRLLQSELFAADRPSATR